MQSLCQHDVQGGSLSGVCGAVAAGEEIPPAVLANARTLCEYYGSNADSVNSLIKDVLEHWDLSRVDSVSRNVIRVAAVELMQKEVPPKVVLNEAIEIAREYGSDKSARFVNGVLDALWKKMPDRD